MNFSEEDLDDLRNFSRSNNARHVMKLLDDSIEAMKTGFLSVPLDKDPEKASLVLYAKRMELEGALYLRNAFSKKVQDLRSAK